VPSGTRSHCGIRRTVRDEGVGTREQPVRAPIQHCALSSSLCALVLSQVCGLRQAPFLSSPKASGPHVRIFAVVRPESIFD
jgi:hypothetical protein